MRFWGPDFHFPLLSSSTQSHSLQAQISTEVFYPATLPLALLNRKLSENQMKTTWLEIKQREHLGIGVKGKREK